jgi:hypothetical protein
VAAFIDLVGGGYVELALELVIAGDRIDSRADRPERVHRPGRPAVGPGATSSGAVSCA